MFNFEWKLISKYPLGRQKCWWKFTVTLDFYENNWREFEQDCSGWE